MDPIDWAVVAGYLAWMVWDGVRMSKRTGELEGYLLASRSLPWWAVGLSVMATQLSAITMVSTTGQGYAEGMKFVQFYFGLPIAMIILSVTVVPFFWRAKVYTAYEYLERRFDLKTRTLTAFLFLVSRGLACSVIIAAPSLILSIVLGWNLTLTVLAIGAPTVIYTMVGGVQAVTWTDVKQMVIIVAGILAAVVVLILGLPDGMSLGSALQRGRRGGQDAGARLPFRFERALHVLVRPHRRHVPGAVVLRLRPEPGAAVSDGEVGEGRPAVAVHERVLQDSAAGADPADRRADVRVLPVPQGADAVQSRAAGTGEDRRTRGGVSGARAGVRPGVRGAPRGGAWRWRRRTMARPRNTTRLGRRSSRPMATSSDVRQRASALVKEATNTNYADVNYVFPNFVIEHMPVGLVGLLIAAIFAAAMSSIAAELNSLATATVIDVYKRHMKPVAEDSHYLLVSKWATAGWGVFACVAAVYAVQLGSLIEVVNRFGSYFYGSILGVFILAIGVKRANGHGAFVGLIGGMVTVWAVATYTRHRVSLAERRRRRGR